MTQIHHIPWKGSTFDRLYIAVEDKQWEHMQAFEASRTKCAQHATRSQMDKLQDARRIAYENLIEAQRALGAYVARKVELAEIIPFTRGEANEMRRAS